MVNLKFFLAEVGTGERRLAIVRDLEGLHAVVRAQADELQVASDRRLGGINPDMPGKVLAPKPVKTLLGRRTLGPILGALGLRRWSSSRTKRRSPELRGDWSKNDMAPMLPWEACRLNYESPSIKLRPVLSNGIELTGAVGLTRRATNYRSASAAGSPGWLHGRAGTAHDHCREGKVGANCYGVISPIAFATLISSNHAGEGLL